jgi:hypothetical protein
VSAFRVGWHCTADHTAWPGCGRCEQCRLDAPRIYAAARALMVAFERLESAMACVELELEARGQ